MNETVEFVDKDKYFRIVVLKTFIDQCPNYKDISVAILLKDHSMGTYLHNTKGYALEFIGPGCDKNKHAEYRLNGVRLSEEEGSKLAHNANFADKVETILDSNG